MYVSEHLKPLLELLKKNKNLLKVAGFEKASGVGSHSLAKYLCNSGSAYLGSSDIDKMKQVLKDLRSDIDKVIPPQPAAVKKLVKKTASKSVKVLTKPGR